jgi:hypothetical protein
MSFALIIFIFSFAVSTQKQFAFVINQPEFYSAESLQIFIKTFHRF